MAVPVGVLRSPLALRMKERKREPLAQARPQGALGSGSRGLRIRPSTIAIKVTVSVLYWYVNLSAKADG